MNFEKFQKKFLSQLKSKNKNCLKLIEHNKNLIQENLGNESNFTTIVNFVDAINDIIVDNSNLLTVIFENEKAVKPFGNKYELIEKVLKHPYFNTVLTVFVKSDVLLRACKVGNKNAAKWLLTMNINPYYQDADGMSALMYAAHQDFDFVIKPFFCHSRCLNLEDNHGENVLFHYMRNPKFIAEVIVESNKFYYDFIMNSKININHTNRRGETILIFCIKNNIFEPIRKYLFHNNKIDVNIADNDGKTAAMYLIEKGLCPELLEFNGKKCNYDYTDMNGQSTMSILMNKMYSSEKNNNDTIPYENYVRIMSSFVHYQCDFNYPIDNDENTPFMIILLMNDIATAKFCAQHLNKLDLSVKNKYGENTTSLCYKLNHYELLPYLRSNPTFDYNYRDPLNQNTLLMISAINNTVAMKELLENDPGIINEVNGKNENALIIASKINKTKTVEILLERGIDVNHQDHLGNTALHYAVEIQSPFLIHRLMRKKPNIYIKNRKGQSPLDYAHEIEENREDILSMLLNPSYDLKNIKFNRSVSSKYEEKIKNYLTPYANNDYPEYKSSSMMEDIKKEIYNKNSKTISKTSIIKSLKWYIYYHI